MWNIGEPNLMKISVCISTYRGAARLRELLASIVSPRDSDVEVIVFDDGSPEEDALAIRDVVANSPCSLGRFPLRHSTNRGYAACMRDAVAASTGEVVLLLDDDTLVPPSLFLTLRGLMTAMPGVGVLAWRSLGKNPGQSQQPVGGMLQPATQLASYCFAFRRAVWDEVGGFDPNLKFFMIDSDFCVRATLAGHPCYRVWWPLVPHFEHGGSGDGSVKDTVPFSREEVAKRDAIEFHAKWGCNPDEMEKRALKSLEERAK